MSVHTALSEAAGESQTTMERPRFSFASQRAKTLSTSLIAGTDALNVGFLVVEFGNPSASLRTV